MHSERVSLSLIPKQIGGIRLDWEKDQTPLEVEERLNHYKDFGLRLLVSRYDHAVIAHSRWKGKLHIHFKNEPEYKHHDFHWPEEYAVLVRSLLSRGVRVWGPCLSTWHHSSWWERFREADGFSLLAGVDVHGYGFSPEQLPTLVRYIRTVIPKSKPLIIGEYGPEGKDIVSFFYSAIRHLPVGVDINLWRGPDPPNRGEGLFTNFDYTKPYDWVPGVKERWDKAFASSVSAETV